MSEALPTDDEVLAELRQFGNRAATYVVKNRLRRSFRSIKTYHVLYRLKRLERAGKVRRSDHNPYVVQIIWESVA